MDRYHVYPVGDLIWHETEAGECPCGPEIELVEDENGDMQELVIHYAFDGREQQKRVY